MITIQYIRLQSFNGQTEGSTLQRPNLSSFNEYALQIGKICVQMIEVIVEIGINTLTIPFPIEI